VAKVEAIGGKALKLKLDGVRGFPDRSCLFPPREWGPDDISGYFHDPRVFFIEFKRTQVGIISAQQREWRRVLEALGFEVYLVDTDAEFDLILEEWR
jgi:hypothetical protein